MYLPRGSEFSFFNQGSSILDGMMISSAENSDETRKLLSVAQNSTEENFVNDLQSVLSNMSNDIMEPGVVHLNNTILTKSKDEIKAMNESQTAKMIPFWNITIQMRTFHRTLKLKFTNFIILFRNAN